MEELRFLSGVLLVSEDPARLAEFYRGVLNVPLETEEHDGALLHWGCTLGDVHFAVHPVADFPDHASAVGSVKLAFTVFDLSSYVHGLQAKAVTLLNEPVDTGYFKSAMIQDPDGNLVELTELGADWFDYLAKRRAEGDDVVARYRALSEEA